MEIRQLEIFVLMARNLSFSKTAEEMYISQPSVSVHIGALEKSLGTQLFIRNSKGVSLTKAGLDFLIYAKKMLELRDQALKDARAEDQGLSGVIDIIASTIPAQQLLPEIIAGFRQEWPNVVFHVDQADSRQVEQELRCFRYDFGMVGTLPKDGRFVHLPIFVDELVLAMPGDSPTDDAWARENFADCICAHPFVMREPGSGTRTEIESLLQKLGVDARDLHVAAYLPDAHSILRAISSGMGISLVSKNVAAMYKQTGLVRMVEMNNPLFRRQIYLLQNKEVWLSPLQQAFADFVKGFYQ